MIKKCLQNIICLTIFIACHEVDQIKSKIKPKSMVEQYGDGEHYIQNIFIPIQTDHLSYQDSLPNIPIIGKISRFFGDVLIANSNEGKLLMSFSAHLPEIPQEIDSIKLKEFFLFISPTDNSFRDSSAFSKILTGKREPSFNFLKSFSFIFTGHNIPQGHKITNPISSYYKDHFLEKNMSLTESSYFFLKRNEENEILFHDFNNVDIKKIQRQFSYDRVMSHKFKIDYHIEKKEIEDIKDYYLVETEDPNHLRQFLRHEFASYLDKVMIFKKLLVIKTKEDIKPHEIFLLKALLENMNIREQYLISHFTQCHPEICLSIKNNGLNLVDLMKHQNSLEILGFLHAFRVPQSFKIDGYTEFEIKTRLDF